MAPQGQNRNTKPQAEQNYDKSRNNALRIMLEHNRNANTAPGFTNTFMRLHTASKKTRNITNDVQGTDYYWLYDEFYKVLKRCLKNVVALNSLYVKHVTSVRPQNDNFYDFHHDVFIPKFKQIMTEWYRVYQVGDETIFQVKHFEKVQMLFNDIFDVFSHTNIDTEYDDVDEDEIDWARCVLGCQYIQGRLENMMEVMEKTKVPVFNGGSNSLAKKPNRSSKSKQG
jgi:hypothetical protein